MGATPDNLPDEGVEYWALGPVCLALHLAPWPEVWMVHFGMKRGGLGHYVAPSVQILNEFWSEKQPSRIIGWTNVSNRSAVAFGNRCGFERDGEFTTNKDTVQMTSWRA